MIWNNNSLLENKSKAHAQQNVSEQDQQQHQQLTKTNNTLQPTIIEQR